MSQALASSLEMRITSIWEAVLSARVLEFIEGWMDATTQTGSIHMFTTRINMKDRVTMQRTSLYLICAVLAVAVVFLGYQYYESRRATQGVEIKVDGNGVSIQKN